MKRDSLCSSRVEAQMSKHMQMGTRVWSKGKRWNSCTPRYCRQVASRILPFHQSTPGRNSSITPPYPEHSVKRGCHRVLLINQSEKDFMYIMNLNTIGSLIWISHSTLQRPLNRQVINIWKLRCTRTFGKPTCALALYSRGIIHSKSSMSGVPHTSTYWCEDNFISCTVSLLPESQVIKKHLHC